MTRCTDCGTRNQSVEYLSVTRFGGGSYNRPGRSYSTTICEPCAGELLTYKQEAHSYVGGNRYSWRSIEYALRNR